MTDTIHILTNDCIALDFIPIDGGLCPICLRETTLQLGYLGIRCPLCEAVVSSEDSLPDLIRKRRRYLGFSREYMAEKLRILPATLRYYETKRCSLAAYKRAGELVRGIHGEL